MEEEGSTLLGDNVSKLSSMKDELNLAGFCYRMSVTIDPREWKEICITVSLLHYAVNCGARKCMEWIIEQKADINAQSDTVPSPLELAISRIRSYSGNEEVYMLLKAGALCNNKFTSSIWRPSLHGTSLLQFGLRYGGPDISNHMIRHGARLSYPQDKHAPINLRKTDIMVGIAVDRCKKACAFVLLYLKCLPKCLRTHVVKNMIWPTRYEKGWTWGLTFPEDYDYTKPFSYF